MSEADKIFEGLEFEKKHLFSKNGKPWGLSYYYPKTTCEIIFDFIDKEVCVSSSETGEAVFFGVEELQAINEKCKELGWV